MLQLVCTDPVFLSSQLMLPKENQQLLIGSPISLQDRGVLNAPALSPAFAVKSGPDAGAAGACTLGCCVSGISSSCVKAPGRLWWHLQLVELL